MTPKEKAYNIIDKMHNVDFHDLPDELAMQFKHAIKCALIAVDEIMSVPKQLLYTIYVHRFRTCEETDINTWNEEESIIVEEFIALDYWQQVKQEIEKL